MRSSGVRREKCKKNKKEKGKKKKKEEEEEPPPRGLLLRLALQLVVGHGHNGEDQVDQVKRTCGG